MSDVPSNLIPTRVTQLPLAPVADENSLMMIVYQGNNYQIRVGDLLSVAGVPTTRQVIAGTGMTGGGQLSANVTLSIANGGVGSAQLANSGVTPGTYGDASNIPVFIVDATGRVTAATTVPASGGGGGVPTTREVIAGTGLNGGGALSANVTLNANLSNATPQPGFQAGAAGTSTDISRADHKHPAVNLAVDDEVDGILGLGNGGTAKSIVPDEGAIIWCGADGLYVGPVGAAGQLLQSNGVGEYVWADASTFSVLEAENLKGGAAFEIPFQSAADTTGFIPAPIAPNLLLKWNGSSFEWGTIAGAGTVTSVDASGGTTGLTFSGGPITAAGTLTMAGTLVVANGGTGATTATDARTNLSAAKSGDNTDITSLTGMTGPITSPDYVQFDVTPTLPADATGMLYWNSDDSAKTLNLVMEGGTVVQQVGEEIYYRVKASAAISNGQTVMFTGTLGASGALLAAPATGLTATNADYYMGVATEDIALNGWGYITQFGVVRGINTTGGAEAWVDGQTLYYNPAVPGGLTKTIPVAPAAKIEVASVIHAASNGSLFVRAEIGFRLSRLNDVETGTPTTGDVLQYTAGNYWTHTPSANVSVGTATNIAGGAANQIPYQTAAGTTSFITAASGTNYVLNFNGSTFTWVEGTISGIPLGSNLNALTLGSYLTGTSYNGSGAVTAAVDATSANTASKVVARDASGNFSAGTITASLSGNATTATTASATSATLTRGSYLTGSNFNGSAATTWAVDATTTATASKVVARDASGYVFSVYFNATGTFPLTGSALASGMATFTGTNGTDNFGRGYSAAAAAALLSGQSMNIAGNATTATTATNLAGGAASQIPYQTGSGATSFLANGTAGQILTSNGASAPTWSGVSGGTF